jgi:hypothetical protein
MIDARARVLILARPHAVPLRRELDGADHQTDVMGLAICRG